MILRASKKPRVDTATKPSTAVVKKKDVLNVMEAVNSSHLSPDTIAARNALLLATKTVCGVYTTDSRHLHETHENQVGEDLGDSVCCILSNPRYNVRC